jgi:protein involved in polysaccharide export with SLBB domain
MAQPPSNRIHRKKTLQMARCQNYKSSHFIATVSNMLNFYSHVIGMMLLITFVTACQNQVDSSGFPPPAPINKPAVRAGVSKSDVFAPNDYMELIVEEDKSLSGRYLVRPGGYVIMPRLGRVHIGGLSRAGAEAKMKELLENSQLIDATVMVERWPGNDTESGASDVAANRQHDTITVLLTGRVSRPGMHKIPVYNGENPGVYRAILSAGGLAEFSRSSRVTIRRNDKSGRLHLIPVRLDLIEKGEIPDIPIGNYDVIDVGERVFGF